MASVSCLYMSLLGRFASSLLSGSVFAASSSNWGFSCKRNRFEAKFSLKEIKICNQRIQYATELERKLKGREHEESKTHAKKCANDADVLITMNYIRLYHILSLWLGRTTWQVSSMKGRLNISVLNFSGSICWFSASVRFQICRSCCVSYSSVNFKVPCISSRVRNCARRSRRGSRASETSVRPSPSWASPHAVFNFQPVKTLFSVARCRSQQRLQPPWVPQSTCNGSHSSVIEFAELAAERHRPWSDKITARGIFTYRQSRFRSIQCPSGSFTAFSPLSSIFTHSFTVTWARLCRHWSFHKKKNQKQANPNRQVWQVLSSRKLSQALCRSIQFVDRFSHCGQLPFHPTFKYSNAFLHLFDISKSPLRKASDSTPTQTTWWQGPGT